MWKVNMKKVVKVLPPAKKMDTYTDELDEMQEKVRGFKKGGK